MRLADPVFGVIPVLVGPLQVLLALLPAILFGVGSALFALFKPSGMKRLIRFLWHQKLFSVCLAAVVAGFWFEIPQRLWRGSKAGKLPVTAGEWPAARGGPSRTGRTGDSADATAPTINWNWQEHATVYSSPTVAADRVYFTTVTGLGPFTPEGRGAVVCADAETGRELWRYEPGDFRATFSSPAIAEGRIVVGEGLHKTSDARVTCLDLAGRLQWDFRTKSHVESTPCIHSGRVFVGAGGDGFYCFSLDPIQDNPPGTATLVQWHLPAEKYPDCESSPISDGKTVWFGLGEEGQAICAVDAATGEERWRLSTPYPVFAPPTLVDGKILVGMGNGNFMRTAAEIQSATLETMKEDGKSAEEIAEAKKRLAPAGAVWCVNAETGEPLWKLPLPETVLGGIPFANGNLYVACRDGRFLRVSMDGTIERSFSARGPLLASPAVGNELAYVATRDGLLFAVDWFRLKPLWELPVQTAGNLVSSPALANGKLYIGTENQGLRCLGGPEKPAPPLWNQSNSNGHGGGRADEIPLPGTVAIDWEFDLTDALKDPESKRLHPTSAVVLHDWLSVALTESPSGSREKDKISGLSHGRLIAIPLDSLLWADEPSRRLGRVSAISGLSSSPRVGQGETLVTASQVPRREGERHGTLWGLRMTDGKIFWESDRTPAIGARIDANRELAFVPREAGVLEAVELATGKLRWSRRFSGNSDEVPPRLALSARGDLVAVGTSAGELLLLDAPTGGVLWSVSTPQSGELTLSMTDENLVVQSRSGLEVQQLLDGSKVFESQATGWPQMALALAWRRLDDHAVGRSEDDWSHLASRKEPLPPLLTDGTIALVQEGATIQRIDLATGEKEIWWKSDKPFDHSVWVASKGGVVAILQNPDGGMRVVRFRASGL